LSSEYNTLLIFTEVAHLLDSHQPRKELFEKGWCGIEGICSYNRGKYTFWKLLDHTISSHENCLRLTSIKNLLLKHCCHLPDLNPSDFYLGGNVKKKCFAVIIAPQVIKKIVPQ
jgi:hypothetical protein